MSELELRFDDKDHQRIINVLGVVSRLKILGVLTEFGPMTISQIEEKLKGEIQIPNISQQVKRLEEVGLIKKEREGTAKVCTAVYKSIRIRFS